MTRHASILSMVLCVLAGFCAAQLGDLWGEQRDIAVLKAKRVMLLQERAGIYDELFARGAISAVDLAAPKIELIRVQIEYAKNNDDRRKLYDKWLKHHDALIRAAELLEKAPVAMSRSKSEQLKLKAERLRIEIERESLD
ncbi:hypothetical protein [Mariniblastus fucicola]|uniref:Uncharacterized protein n=1 Tax=Mariniblastus fucicola TaxID=980251 RepID=A0A5B9PAL2_9BACT|nr:hypothetical protein [Mariniblastus fucicola]QEG22265.1 hypothetical protein MFFC18_21410 [Mariniblastus fucicola]